MTSPGYLNVSMIEVHVLEYLSTKYLGQVHSSIFSKRPRVYKAPDFVTRFLTIGLSKLHFVFRLTLLRLGLFEALKNWGAPSITRDRFISHGKPCKCVPVNRGNNLRNL